MGKRSDFRRHVGDTYKTPEAALLPLLPFLHRETFIEPCAGDGRLCRYLEKHGHTMVEAWDIRSRTRQIRKLDARTTQTDLSFTCFITNPPWTRSILHPIIENLSNQNRTWLLFDADWMHTKQASGLLHRCSLIVSVGRIKWFPRSRYTGKDNCVWYRFDYGHTSGPRFVGRKQPRKEKSNGDTYT